LSGCPPKVAGSIPATLLGLVAGNRLTETERQQAIGRRLLVISTLRDATRRATAPPS
jgi:hypothetical protein